MNKLALGYEYLGEQQVKNIVQPVRVYRVVVPERQKVRSSEFGVQSPKAKIFNLVG